MGTFILSVGARTCNSILGLQFFLHISRLGSVPSLLGNSDFPLLQFHLYWWCGCGCLAQVTHNLGTRSKGCMFVQLRGVYELFSRISSINMFILTNNLYFTIEQAACLDSSINYEITLVIINNSFPLAFPLFFL